MIKILHTADLHACKARMPDVLASLATLREAAVEKTVDLIAIAGDIWQSGVMATGASQFPEFIEAIRSLADITPVVLIYGTPSHDLGGSLDVFEQLDTAYGVTVLRPGEPYFLLRDRDFRGVTRVTNPDSPETRDRRLLIMGVPEPTKGWLLSGGQAMGKDESSAALKEALGALFLGMAATRKEYENIPCVVLYHGQIAGAKLQNQQIVRAISVGRDDLSVIGADYYALGDIHEPQQIGELPMYYPGSAYPINWGETHQAGFNFIEIPTGVQEIEVLDAARMTLDPKKWHCKVSRLDYPHPRNLKFTQIEGAQIQAGFIKGNRVWWEIMCSQATAADISIPEKLAMLEKFGALPGSKVTINVAPQEMLRAGEITEAPALWQKLGIYGHNRGLEVPQSILDKATMLQAETGAATADNGAHLKIKSLQLRGAIGIWKGQGRDDFAIVLDDHPEGLIALVGHNGAGKSTLIENMHPWPQMLTRDGKLSSHFRLKDSYRDLYLTDERTGDQWRFLIQINGASQAGSCEYHVFKNGTPHPQSNGRLDPYMAIVEDLFGSLQLYQRSAFVSQKSTKGNPDLADATKGERKQLFRELAGLDYLQEYAGSAKDRARLLTEEIAGDRGWIDAVTSELEQMPGLVCEREQKGVALAAAVAELRTAEEEKATCAANIEALIERRDADQALRSRSYRVVAEIEGVRGKIERLTADREELAKIVECADEAQAKIDNWKELEDERQECEKSAAAWLDAQHKALVEYTATIEAIRAERSRLEESKRGAEKARNDLSQERSQAKEAIDHYGDLLAGDRHDKCPECGAQLPWAEAEEGARKKWEGRLEKNQQRIWSIDQKELPEAEEAVQRTADELKKVVDPGAPVDTINPQQDRLEEICGLQEYLGVDEAREIVRQAGEAGARDEEIAKQIDLHDENQGKLMIELEELSGRFDEEIAQMTEVAKQDLLLADNAYVDATNNATRLRAEVDYLDNQIAGFEQKVVELKERKAATATKQHDADEWSWLQSACGPDGIQALELDALAPSIESTANRLLEAAYGSRFTVRFSTTRMDSTGKRQLEDFQILIHDAEHGTEQELSTLSGGEAVWIKRSLYDAFGSIRARNTGIRFLTVFQDETDGALDPEAREHYTRMLTAAHEAAGRAHTILITHSREVQEMIGRSIDMEKAG